MPPTEEQAQILTGKFGIALEKKEKNTVKEFIELLEILQQNGVNVSKISKSETIETLAKKSNINLDVLREKGIDLTIKIGSKKEQIARVYRGKKPRCSANRRTSTDIKRKIWYFARCEKENKNSRFRSSNICIKCGTV